MLRPGLISLLMFACSVLLPGEAAARRPWLTLQIGPPSTTQTEQLPKGQIVEKVACANVQGSLPSNSAAEPGQSYALYLPSNYTSTRNWPIVYAFDPAARGKLPVEKFKDAAEKYGWIVVGSNNSHNGPMQAAIAAWKAMWTDTHERFAIDEARVYTTGFSGGARVAVMLAHLCRDCVAGVIGCGAGFPLGVAPAPAMRFVFFGTAGVDDFNFAEVRTLEDSLLKAKIAHHIRVFEGRHEWAPPAVALDALEWMELQAMKVGKRQRDDDLINELWQKYSASAKALEAANKPYEAFQILAGCIDSFKGLHDTSELERKVTQLRDSRAVKDAIREERQQISRQKENEREIYTLIAATAGEDPFQASTQLRAALAGLQESAKGTTDTAERRVARRVSEGIFIGLFEEGSNLLQTQKRYDEAAKKFELAVEVAPDRSGAFFYLARAYALNGQKRKSLQALKSAIEKGFSDLSAITDNKAFDSLRNEPQYQQIIQSLKTAH